VHRNGEKPNLSKVHKVSTGGFWKGEVKEGQGGVKTKSHRTKKHCGGKKKPMKAAQNQKNAQANAQKTVEKKGNVGSLQGKKVTKD